MENQNIKILILRLSALGDTIHTLPLAYALKKTYPDCKIGWVVEDKAKLFIEGNPLVDDCYVIQKKEWKKRGFFSLKNISEFNDIVQKINAQGYDAVIDTQQLWKSASLLPFLSIKRKITLSGGREFSWLFANEIVPASHDLFDFNYHVVNRNLELAKYMGADISELKFMLKKSDENIVKKIDMLLQNMDNSRKTVVISPATTWENKHWKEKNWSELITFLAGKVNIVITGTKGDLTMIQRITDMSVTDDYTVLAGETDLLELAELFRRSDLVISPDSGSAHIAWAVEHPAVLTLFFSTAEKRNAPFGKNCYTLSANTDCHPCSKRKCPLKQNKNKCIDSVTFQEVKKFVKDILQLS